MLALLSACGTTTPATTAPTPAATQSVEVSPTMAPAPTQPPPVAPTLAPTTQSANELIQDLVDFIAANVQPTLGAFSSTEDGTGTPQVLPLQTPDASQSLWAVYSTGATLDPNLQHFVAIYAQASNSWQEIGRVTLANPSQLANGAVTQVEIEPTRVWLAVRGSSGLIGPCCYDLLSFDGTTLRNELAFTERIITATEVTRNAEGAAEVRITVERYQGAANPSAPPETLVFVWDGKKITPSEPDQ